MKQRVVTAIILIAVLAPVLWWGGYPLHFTLALLAALAVYEILHSIDPKVNWLGAIILFLMIETLTYCNNYNFIYYLGLFIVGVFVLQIVNRDANIGPMSYVFLISVLISLALRSFIAIYDSSFNLFILILISNYLGDTGAYLIGSTLGKKKLIPEISPKKTVEGFYGGFILAFIFALIYGLWVLKLSLLKALISGLVVGIAGQIGDLSFSVLKRKFKIKDFGSILPGHGGVLDRIDSLIFNLLIFYSVWELISRWSI